MEKVKTIEIFRSGVIIIESRLEHCYYDYSSGREEFAYDRIAESICNIQENFTTNRKFEIYLDEVNRVDETMTSKVSRQLMLVVNGVDCSHDKPEEFQNDLFTFTIELVKRLATISNWQARIEVGGHCFIVTPEEEN